MSAPKPCEELTCHGLIAFLRNPQTGRLVPADWDSLDNDEKEAYERGGFEERGGTANWKKEVCFIPLKHVSHYKTCANPQRFTRARGGGPR